MTNQKNGYHLAQFNVSRMRVPLEDPLMDGFKARLDELHHVAEKSPGFIWRLQDGSGNSTEIKAYDDPLMMVNMTVWESAEALQHYTFRTSHREVLKLGKKWFEPYQGPYLVLWWIKAGHLPTVLEGKERLEMLQQKGATDQAFDFRNLFPAPETTSDERY